MRAIIALIVIIYIVGIGVALSPTIEAKWSGGTASDFATGVAQALPGAVAWPGLPQHRRPWLTAVDGLADVGFRQSARRLAG